MRVGNSKMYRSDLRNLPNWNASHPLVVINGCETAALDPSTITDFVTGFVRLGASGVIGTDITVFEALATEFAQSCMRFFVKDGLQIGESVRRARLEMLKSCNPMGLAYMPFVHANLSLYDRRAGASETPN